ncbi:MAG TPA: thiamine pyrophosphate-binding protein [Allosphingosinicella sp.]|nr:thiamine pyrophosphate-binding protein [Allosphingosinicella sp.]
MSTTVAELLVRTLADVGVRQVFGIVGDALNPFTDAIRRQRIVEWVGVRHEEGAALAAAGQAKLTGRLGVCCGTTGPGGNHLVAGLYEAAKDHAPVLAISGDVPLKKRGTDGLQENEPNLLFRDVALYTQMIVSGEQAPAVFHEAIAHAYGGRGVAHINIPPDVFGAAAKGEVPSLATLRPRPEVAPAQEDVNAAAKLIAEAETVTVLCGAGCRGAEAELVRLAERLRAPLVHTYRAKDLLPYDHPHWIGGLGMIGSRAGVDAVADAGLLLMLGTDYPYPEYLPTHGNVVQIDERGFALGRRTSVVLGIVGSVRPAVSMLLERLEPRSDGGFLEKANEARAKWDGMLTQKADPARSRDRIHPQAVARLVSDNAREDAVFVNDTGEVTLWAANWTRQRGRQRIIGSFNNAAVGTALGLANGAQALERGRQVIVQVGDGGFTMLAGELMTAVEHRLPLKVVVYDNSGWGLVHIEMEGAGMPAMAGAAFPNMDFAAYARACGAAGFSASEPAALEQTVTAFLAAEGPAVLHAKVDPDELPAMPHIDVGQAWRFGIAKAKEKLLGAG